jgi:hypothetical protein
MRLSKGECDKKRKEWLLELESLSLRPVFEIAFDGLTFHQAAVVEARLVFLHAIKSPGALYQATKGLTVCDEVKRRVDLSKVPKAEPKPLTHGVFRYEGRLVVMSFEERDRILAERNSLVV